MSLALTQEFGQATDLEGKRFLLWEWQKGSASGFELIRSTFGQWSRLLGVIWAVAAFATALRMEFKDCRFLNRPRI